MLQTIRDKTQGWIAGSIMSLVILSFAFFGIRSYWSSSSSTNSIVKINDHEVPKHEFVNFYEKLRLKARAQKFEISDAEIKKQALNSLIDLEVIKQAAKHDKFQVFMPQVQAYLESLPDFQVNNEFSLEKFNHFLANTAYQPKNFFELISTNLMIDQERLGIELSSIALPEEISDTISYVSQLRDFDFIQLLNNSIQYDEKLLTGKEIENYYQAHLSQYLKPEQVKIEYLELSPKDISRDIVVSDTELLNYYQENKNSFLSPAEWKLAKLFIPIPPDSNNEALERIKTKVYQLAEEVKDAKIFAAKSLDYSDAKNYYPLEGYLTLDNAPIDLKSSIAKLTSAGSVSDPISLKQGYIILKVIDYKQPKELEFTMIKDRVRARLVELLAEESFAKAKEKMSTMAFETPDTLQAIAKLYKLPILESDFFSSEKGSSPLTQEALIRAAAFNNDVLNGNNSDLIPLGADKVIILRIKNHEKASTMPLSQVQSDIIEQLKKDKINLANMELAKTIRKKLAFGASPEDISKEYSLKWETIKSIGRYSTTHFDSAILETAFKLPRLKENANLLYTIVKTKDGLAILAVKNVQNGLLPKDKAQLDVFSETIQNTLGVLEYQLFRLYSVAQAKIKINAADSE